MDWDNPCQENKAVSVKNIKYFIMLFYYLMFNSEKSNGGKQKKRPIWIAFFYFVEFNSKYVMDGFQMPLVLLLLPLPNTSGVGDKCEPYPQQKHDIP